MEKRLYSVEILECPKDLTPKQRIGIKDTSNAIPLDEILKDGGEFKIAPDWYAVLQVTNEKSETKIYNKYIVVDKNGSKYMTGSETFFNAFIDIFNEMGDEFEYEISCFKLDSKNYKGKQFITCSIVL